MCRGSSAWRPLCIEGYRRWRIGSVDSGLRDWGECIEPSRMDLPSLSPSFSLIVSQTMQSSESTEPCTRATPLSSRGHAASEPRQPNDPSRLTPRRQLVRHSHLTPEPGLSLSEADRVAQHIDFGIRGRGGGGRGGEVKVACCAFCRQACAGAKTSPKRGGECGMWCFWICSSTPDEESPGEGE